MGGAVGDAMGAPFEGLWSDDIPNSDSLVSSFHEYHGYPTGQYTDDTQLTIATIQSVVQNGEIVISDIACSISELWRNHSVIGPGGALEVALLLRSRQTFSHAMPQWMRRTGVMGLQMVSAK